MIRIDESQLKFIIKGKIHRMSIRMKMINISSPFVEKATRFWIKINRKKRGTRIKAMVPIINPAFFAVQNV